MGRRLHLHPLHLGRTFAELHDKDSCAGVSKKEEAMKKITHGLIGVVLLTWSAAAFAEMSARAKETLRGLPGVTVVVEPLQDSAEQDGLTRRQLQDEVEHQLQAAGIHLLT